MLDDKVIVSWNGLMIGALAYSGQVLESTEYVNAAKKAADFILRDMKRADGRLYATYRKGRSKLNAYLDDYVFLAHGLLDLHVACGDKKYLDEAIRLMDTSNNIFMIQRAAVSSSPPTIMKICSAATRIPSTAPSPQEMVLRLRCSSVLRN